MKVTSKELYAILREELAAEMKAGGFRRLKGGLLAWSRPHGHEQLTVWFQCDRYGWFADFGSSFTLEFQLHTDAVIGAMGALRRSERFGALLSAQDRETVRLINNRILEQLPGPGGGNPVFAVKETLREAFLAAYRPESGPYSQNRDIWLHYAAPEHVSTWAGFFRPRMLGLASSFARAMGAN